MSHQAEIDAQVAQRVDELEREAAKLDMEAEKLRKIGANALADWAASDAGFARRAAAKLRAVGGAQ